MLDNRTDMAKHTKALAWIIVALIAIAMLAEALA
jgi:hypothetical protein